MKTLKVRLTLTEESSEDEVHEIFAHALGNVNEEKPAKAEKPEKETENDGTYEID